MRLLAGSLRAVHRHKHDWPVVVVMGHVAEDGAIHTEDRLDGVQASGHYQGQQHERKPSHSRSGVLPLSLAPRHIGSPDERITSYSLSTSHQPHYQQIRRSRVTVHNSGIIQFPFSGGAAVQR